MLILKPAHEHELILMHDAYFNTDEPDAPEKPFYQLSTSEKETQLAEYRSGPVLSAFDKQNIVGFVGLFPDDDFFCLGLFYLILPQYRGKGYFSKVLQSVLEYRKVHFNQYQLLRALTRKDNLPSVRGLIRAGFIESPEELETEDENISYLEFLLPLKKVK